MPTYEYVCDSCGHQFEKFQSMKEPPVKICPKCKKKKVRRLIGTGAGVLFKGKGFYQTDYRSPRYEKDAKKDSPAGKDCSSTGCPHASKCPSAPKQ